MSIFQSTPPDRKERHNLTIVRTPAKGKVGGVILAPSMWGAAIHFHGRSLPCSNDQACPICKTGNVPRWTGYLPIWLPGWIKPALLELPTAAAEQVAAYAIDTGKIEHKSITCDRPKGRANSRIRIDIRTENMDGYKLPAAPDVQRALCLIWQIDYDDIWTSLKKKMGEHERYQLKRNDLNGSKSPIDL